MRKFSITFAASLFTLALVPSLSEAREQSPVEASAPVSAEGVSDEVIDAVVTKLHLLKSKQRELRRLKQDKKRDNKKGEARSRDLQNQIDDLIKNLGGADSLKKMAGL